MNSELEIKVVGTGSAFTKTQSHASILLTTNGKNYLIDCGFKVPQALHDMGIDMKDIDGIIITHVHADHTGGLEEFGFTGHYVLNKKFDLYLASDLVKEVWDKTLAGGMEQLSEGIGTLDTFFNVHTFNGLEEFKIGELNILPIKTIHVNSSKPSYSFVINDKVFYSGDSILDKGLIQFLYREGVEIFFHDCQFFNYKGTVHAPLEELKTLPEEIRKKIQAIHYGDNFAEFEDELRDASITRAKQGDVYKL